ncbi:MAG: hypothetical protein R3C59_09630 [Planctomycetaceae bacterium]
MRNDNASAPASTILSYTSGLIVRLFSLVMSRCGKKRPPTFGAVTLQLDDLGRAIDHDHFAGPLDRMALPTARWTGVLVGNVLVSLLLGEMLPQLTSNLLSDFMTEHFNLTKRCRLQIDAAVLNLFVHQLPTDLSDPRLQRIVAVDTASIFPNNLCVFHDNLPQKSSCLPYATSRTLHEFINF